MITKMNLPNPEMLRWRFRADNQSVVALEVFLDARWQQVDTQDPENDIAILGLERSNQYNTFFEGVEVDATLALA